MSSNTSYGTQTQQREQRSTNYPATRRLDNEPPNLAETAQDALECFQNYAKERPEVTALVCAGVGFILGWKLKPW